MPKLTDCATAILNRMEPDRPYEPEDLRAFVPDTGMERLREIMHELWVHREVERVAHTGWRRHRSGGTEAPAAARERTAVRPEDLFDHGAFTEFFK